jgi:hypothetical protein
VTDWWQSGFSGFAQPHGLLISPFLVYHTNHIHLPITHLLFFPLTTPATPNSYFHPTLLPWATQLYCQVFGDCLARLSHGSLNSACQNTIVSSSFSSFLFILSVHDATLYLVAPSGIFRGIQGPLSLFFLRSNCLPSLTDSTF